MAESSGMSTLLTVGLIGAGAFLVYELFFSAPQGTVVSSAPSVPATPGQTPTQQATGQGTSISPSPATTNQSASQSTGLRLQSTLTQMIAKMRAAGDDPTKNHTVWGWNYYYQQVTGVPTAPDPTQILPGNAAATTALINMDTWWAGMQSLGLSGLRSIQTFPVPALNTAGNMIYRAHHPLPYNPTYRLAGLGALTQPSGFERALWAGRSIRIGR